MECVGMLMTVGVGGQKPDSLISALEKSVREARPNVLALVSTTGSQTVAEQLCQRLDSFCKYVPFQLSTENNVDKIFSEITEFLNTLCTEHGCDLNTIHVDFTSGTKAMSAGAILAAVSSGVKHLRYIAGERVHGTVQAGFENIQTLYPTRYHSFHNLEHARQNLCSLRYSAALDLLQEIPANALPTSHRDSVEVLQQLTEAWQAWDLFHHTQAADIFKKIDTVPDYLKEFAFNKGNLSTLINLGKALSPDKANAKPSFTLDVLADLYNNAERRFREGKYDDASARLYRLTEMCAQYALQRHNIDSSRVREDQVPEPCRGNYCFEYDKEKNTKLAKLGLQKSYELLQVLDDSLGTEFKQMKELNNLLVTRNQSILAHGIKPINRSTCQKFQDHVYNLLNHLDPDFPTRSRSLQFPWLV